MSRTIKKGYQQYEIQTPVYIPVPDWMRCKMMTSDSFTAIIQNILFLQSICPDAFRELSPKNYMEEIYNNSCYFHFFNGYFKKIGDDTLKILYVVNDEVSYNQLQAAERSTTLKTIADIHNNNLELLTTRNNAVYMDKLIVLSDCTLCHKTCSVFDNYEICKELSSLWGFCTKCYWNI